jgi:ABC-2 type transport system ATP-binding protein
MKSGGVPILEIKNVFKQLNRTHILKNVSLTVYQNEIIGLVGPVGAGKTTLLYIALGLIKPDSGIVKEFGLHFETHRQEILQQINFASSTLKLNGYSSVWENLLTFSRLYRVENAKKKIADLAHYFQIDYLLRQNTKVYRLSSGENSKVNVCKAFLNDPKLLLFDEITAHLDPVSSRLLLRRIHMLNQQRQMSVLFVSQNISELRKICRRVIVLKKGTIVYDGLFPKAHKLTSLYV